MSDLQCVSDKHLDTIITTLSSSAGKIGKGVRYLQRHRLKMETEQDRNSTITKGTRLLSSKMALLALVPKRIGNEALSA
jgi:hypothetical protein